MNEIIRVTPHPNSGKVVHEIDRAVRDGHGNAVTTEAAPRGYWWTICGIQIPGAGYRGFKREQITCKRCQRAIWRRAMKHGF